MNLKHQYMINQLQKLKIKMGNGPDFSDKLVCECWIEEIDDLTKEQFEDACQHTLKNGDFFPSTGKFRGFVILPTASAEELSCEAVELVISSISTCGYNNPERAEKLIGPLGWSLVQILGGWNQVCRSVESYDMIPTLRAQWRKILIGIYKKAERGDLNLPALPESKSPGLQSAKDILRLIVGDKPDNNI